MKEAASQLVKDSASQLRSATRRAKSDVANKLISMFLHELSRSLSRSWQTKLGGAEYENLVRECFQNRCPYCRRDLADINPVIEHLDGMNRYRAGLHVPGNVLVACKRCNGEKRRDDSLKTLSLATTGWASFLSHNGSECPSKCNTCQYWKDIWPDDVERRLMLNQNLERIESFRAGFPEFQLALPALSATLPVLLAQSYIDCQAFAEQEIKLLLEKFKEASSSRH